MATIIDADAHIVEPRALWQEYVEPAFRDRIPPHFDCTFPGVVDELREGCEGLPESAQRKIMGENAAQCYGLA